MRISADQIFSLSFAVPTNVSTPPHPPSSTRGLRSPVPTRSSSASPLPLTVEGGKAHATVDAELSGIKGDATVKVREEVFIAKDDIIVGKSREVSSMANVVAVRDSSAAFFCIDGEVVKEEGEISVDEAIRLALSEVQKEHALRKTNPHLYQEQLSSLTSKKRISLTPEEKDRRRRERAAQRWRDKKVSGIMREMLESVSAGIPFVYKKNKGKISKRVAVIGGKRPQKAIEGSRKVKGIGNRNGKGRETLVLPHNPLDFGYLTPFILSVSPSLSSSSSSSSRSSSSSSSSRSSVSSPSPHCSVASSAFPFTSAPLSSSVDSFPSSSLSSSSFTSSQPPSTAINATSSSTTIPSHQLRSQSASKKRKRQQEHRGLGREHDPNEMGREEGKRAKTFSVSEQETNLQENKSANGEVKRGPRKGETEKNEGKGEKRAHLDYASHHRCTPSMVFSSLLDSSLKEGNGGDMLTLATAEKLEQREAIEKGKRSIREEHQHGEEDEPKKGISDLPEVACVLFDICSSVPGFNPETGSGRAFRYDSRKVKVPTAVNSVMKDMLLSVTFPSAHPFDYGVSKRAIAKQMALPLARAKMRNLKGETKRLHSSMKRLEKEKNKAIRLSESLELKMEKERKKAVRAAGLLEAKEKRSRKLYEEAQKKNRAVGGEMAGLRALIRQLKRELAEGKDVVNEQARKLKKYKKKMKKLQLELEEEQERRLQGSNIVAHLGTEVVELRRGEEKRQRRRQMEASKKEDVCATAAATVSAVNEGFKQRCLELEKQLAVEREARKREKDVLGSTQAQATALRKSLLRQLEWRLNPGWGTQILKEGSRFKLQLLSPTTSVIFQSVFGSYGRFPKKTKSTPVGSITKVLRVEELGRALKTELLNAPVVHQHHQGTRAISCSITDSGVIVQYDPHKAYVKVISAVIVKDEGCAVLKAKELAKSFRVGL